MKNGKNGRQQLTMELPQVDTLESVEDYEFEPIKGYPMLNWKGKRPFRSTQYYPAQRKEVYGEAIEGWRNKIFWGDNLQVMSHLLKEFRGRVNLVYIDPPFDSKADYKKRIELKGKTVFNDQSAFEEKQYTDIWTNDEYLQYMYERLIIIREILSEDGSIYVHVDYHKGAYIKCLMDEVFGQSAFRNELIWKRSLPHNDSKRYGAIHDVLLLYSKSQSFVFHQQFTDIDEKYKKSHYNQVDESGRLYQLTSLSATGPGPARKFGDRSIDPPSGNHWRYSQEKIDALLREGRIVFTSTGNPRYKRYLDETRGSALQSIWTDINAVNSQALEDTKYPTQKPEALLERIIKVSSNPDDIVFDCFMGSGTTQAVATKLGRRFIGADINLGAVKITTKRLLGIAEDLQEQQQQSKLQTEDEEPITHYTGFEIYNVNHYDLFRNPLQAKDILLEALEIQPLDAGHVYDGIKDDRMVKIMPVNRIATRADLSDFTHGGGFDYKLFEKRQREAPTKPVEKITLVCMGHEPDLAAVLKKEAQPFHIDVEVVDILRDKAELEFKRDSEAKVQVQGKHLVIEAFYPMNLPAKAEPATGKRRRLARSGRVDHDRLEL